MKSQKVKIVSKKNFFSFINKLIEDKNIETIGVQLKENKFVFDQLDKAEDLELNYDITILPPKKYFLPQNEELMTFNIKNNFDVKENIDIKKRVIIGIHPYDIIAIQQADKIYLDSQTDNFYKKRRENTIIIGSDIQTVSKNSFAKSMGTHIVEKGFDLLITDLGNKYSLIIGSEKGKDLLNKYAEFRDSRNSEIKKIDKIRKSIEQNYNKVVNINKDEIPSLLNSNYEHSIWKEKSDKCLECASCVMVCPTCFCYDVKDNISLDIKEGKRYRTWDACLLQDFTKIGSGEIFRNGIKERYRHRFYRKGNYLNERYGFVACVGCGRCGTACLPNIADPCDLINDLSSSGKINHTGKFFIKTDKKIEETGIIHMPKKATIKKIEKLTDSERLFKIELDDKKNLNHDPGQFVEVSVFGIGEAPISISSAPDKSPSFEIVVRKIGDVTSKLFSMNIGDKLGIRGPFGNGFDVKELKNKNLLFVAGGLGLPPMRSLVNFVTSKDQRSKYKNITILYGCKQPCEMLFEDEIKKWQKIKDVECKLTVDQCDDGECWAGEIGLITTLFPKIKLDKTDSKNTIAIVIGPPVMYKFVIKCLKTIGFPDENIYVSLERRMKCGVGKCGHCQINGTYVCKEGPVFNYDQIKYLPEAFE